jgi:26S proteasome regulatory subunit N3
VGKIRAIQLEYTDAKESLLQAARKAPTSALGFRIQCNKWAIVVRLLLGEIPERTVFVQKGMKKALTPYFELTNVSNRPILRIHEGTGEDHYADIFSCRLSGLGIWSCSGRWQTNLQAHSVLTGLAI